MLELKNLYFTVTTDEAGNGGKRNIIEHVNFNFEKGKFYGITGPNGSGKTTLAKLIMGINPISQWLYIVFEGKTYPVFPLRTVPKQASPIVFSSQRVSRESLSGICFHRHGN